MRHTTHYIVCFAAGLAISPYALAGEPTSTRSLAGPSTDAEIAELIAELGDPDFERRTYATRRLAAIGMPASSALRDAIEGSCLETSLRARSLLRDYDNRLFAGVSVQLAFSRTRVRWNEPVDLVVTLTNHTMHTARVPFDLSRASADQSSRRAWQVGNALDISDFLSVRTHTQSRIELTVDDIMVDTEVNAAVQTRLEGGPVTSIEPGETQVFRVTDINRGWARYRLLDKGIFTVQFQYDPPWIDPVLADQRIGRVVSNRTEIEIQTAAPSTVSRGAAVAAVHLQRKDDQYVAELINQTDQTLVVNKNFGPSAPFAQGQWILERSGDAKEWSANREQAESWKAFEEKKLEAVAAGERTHLASISAVAIDEVLKEANWPNSLGTVSFRFSYVNMCDRQWQKRQRATLLGNPQAPPVLQSPLPVRILSIRQTSFPLSIDDTP